MGVQGFPTLKIVRPGSKPGKPVIEDYQGARTATGIVEAVKDKINNHVKKVEDKNLESWLAASNETAKAILFTDKGKTSALLKAVAIDFKGSIEVAQVRNTQKATVELFGVEKFPSLLLLPGGKAAQGIVYNGELKKDDIVKFLSQVVQPNEDPAPVKTKAKATKSKKNKEEVKESATKEAKAATDTETSPADATSTESPEGSEESSEPTSRPKEEPIIAPAEPIPLIDTDKQLIRECLGPKTGTCLLATVPKEPSDIVLHVIKTLSEIKDKEFKKGKKTFPFYAFPVMVPKHPEVVDALGLSKIVDIVAVNGKRGWYRQFPRGGEELTKAEVSHASIEKWIQSIIVGEGSKSKLPSGLIEEVEEKPFVFDDEPAVVEEPVATPSGEPLAVPEESQEVVEEGEKIEQEGSDKVTEPIAEVHDEL